MSAGYRYKVFVHCRRELSFYILRHIKLNSKNISLAYFFGVDISMTISISIQY